MSAPEIFRVGDDRLLCDEWYAPTRTVVLRPADPRRLPGRDSVRDVVDELHARGVARILTAALDPVALDPFAAAGFALHEELCVLRHDLRAPLPVVRGRTRRGSTRRDLTAAAAVDRRAFGPDTALDAGGLRAILAATPTCRFRLVDTAADAAVPRGGTAAYALCGAADRTGYVQRVAVDPSCRRRGHARALVDDALAWFRRRHVAQVLVNTQVANAAARHLYLDAGFEVTGDRLAVLVWQRDAPC